MMLFEHTQVNGFEAAIRGMRNPKNSWHGSDSQEPPMCDECNYASVNNCPFMNVSDDCMICYDIGKNDMAVAMRLIKAGSDHRKFLRMITVHADITAPLYWWKEYDTYKVGTVANSCSTMHTIHQQPFTPETFSFDALGEAGDSDVMYEFAAIHALEDLRQKYLETGEAVYWRRLIQLLPNGYNQKRTVMLNYEVLRSMYHARKGHKLTEWHDFCHWVEGLPYAPFITSVAE